MDYDSFMLLLDKVHPMLQRQDTVMRAKHFIMCRKKHFIIILLSLFHQNDCLSLIRLLATGKKAHTAYHNYYCQLHAQVISDELTAMLHSLFLEISRTDIRTTDITYSLLTF